MHACMDGWMDGWMDMDGWMMDGCRGAQNELLTSCVSMCVSTYACMHVLKCMCVSTYACMHVLKCMCVSMCACMHVLKCMCVWACMHACMF
jgi:hypothetical protein